MKIQTVLGNELGKRFTNYMATLGSKNQSQTAAELIDLALRIKEHSKETGRSNREVLEMILTHVMEQTRTLNNMFINTYPNDNLPVEQQEAAKRKIKEMKILSNNDTNVFLNEKPEND